MSGQEAATRRMSPADVEPRVLHLFGLSALVVAQPLYDVLARDPEFFVAHRLQPLDIVLLAVLLVLAVPSVLVLFARVAGRFGPGPQTWIERAGFAALLAIFFLMLVKQAVDQTAVGWTVAATAFGIAATLAYCRSAAVRQVLTLVSVGIVLLPLLFLTRAPIAGLLAPNGALQTPIGRPGRTPPVVVVVFDQLPLVSLLDGNGDVDTRYPHFSALSHDSVWLRNASSVGHFTEFALPAILTGRYPSSSRLPTADDHPENLFTLVGGTYRVNAFEPVTALCPPGVCERQGSPWLERVTGALADLAVVYGHLAVPSTLSSTLPTITQSWKDFGEFSLHARWGARRAEDRRVGPRAWIRSIGASDEPVLHFLHVLLPHEPYEYLPSGQAFVTSQILPGLEQGRWSGESLLAAQSYQQHMLQLGFVDTLLGELVERLRAVDLYDRTLLVVTSDHGASFRPGLSFREMSSQNRAELMAVPMFVKPPGHSGRRVDDTNAETDILPTIANVLEQEIPWPIDGRSLLSVDAPIRSTKRVYYDGGREWFEVEHPLDLTDAVAYKLDALGTSGDLYQAPRLAPHTQLVGRSVSEATQSASSAITVTLDSPSLFVGVDPDGDLIPARISGWVDGVTASHPLDLAVAVNGVIRATTRVSRGDTGGRKRWSAIVAPRSFRPGNNDVAIFAVESVAGNLRLSLASPRSSAVRPRNLALEASATAGGVRVSGFHFQEWIGDRLVSCTDGHGRIVATLDPSRPPEALRISIVRSGPGNSPLRILLDGCELFDARVPAGGWVQTLPLDGCRPRGDATTIEILSEAVAVRDGTRNVGACLDALYFVDAD